MNQHRVLAILLAGSISCAKPTAIETDALRMQRLASSGPVLDTEEYSNAFATTACGPTDFPGLALYLLDTSSKVIPPTTRYIRVTIYQDPRLLAHTRIEWRESRGPGEAVRCSAGSCGPVNSGRIDFGNIKTGKSVDGELNLHFTNGIQVHQRFHARWHPTRVICG